MNREGVYRFLRSRGLRITPLKRRIVESFLEGGCCLSAGEVWASSGSPASFSSVYRCLTGLCEAGFLRPVNGPSGVVLYRRTRDFAPDHGHFRCRVCGLLAPVEEILPCVFIDAIEEKYGLSVQNWDFFLEGRCSLCSNRH
jgi:Fe2+ or Zn2+ uptake regulation protein